MSNRAGRDIPQSLSLSGSKSNASAFEMVRDPIPIGSFDYELFDQRSNNYGKETLLQVLTSNGFRTMVFDLMRWLIIILLGLMTCGPCCRDAFGDVVVEDAAGNLEGDLSRGFMDITQLTMGDGYDEQMTLTIQVRDEFPHSSNLLGMGFQFHIHFFSRTIEVGDFPEQTILVALDHNGWNVEMHPEIKDADGFDRGIDYAAASRQIALSVPLDWLRGMSHARLFSDTSAFPRWRPLTSNPPIEFTLPSLDDAQSHGEDAVEEVPQ